MKIRCKICGDILVGDKKGTFIPCKCGKCFIDETKYYCRIGGEPKNYEKIEEEESYG